MTTSGSKLPQSASTDNLVGTTAWTSADNILDNGSNYASSAGTGGAATYYLRGYNYNASIPAEATLNGITVYIPKYSSQSSALRYTQDNIVALAIASASTGDNKADTSTKWGTSRAVSTYGGVSDTWNSGLTVAQLNASTFGVMISAKNYGATGATAYVDSIYVDITYTVSGSVVASTGPLAMFMYRQGRT